MSKRRQHSELVYLIPPQAGFGPGGTYAVIQPERGFLYNPEYAATNQWPVEREQRLALATVEIVDQMPCPLECGDPDCMEWTDVWTLGGDTRRQAMRNLIARRFSGANYHVSEWEMSDHQVET